MIWKWRSPTTTNRHWVVNRYITDYARKISVVLVYLKKNVPEFFFPCCTIFYIHKLKRSNVVNIQIVLINLRFGLVFFFSAVKSARNSKLLSNQTDLHLSICIVFRQQTTDERFHFIKSMECSITSNQSGSWAHRYSNMTSTELDRLQTAAIGFFSPSLVELLSELQLKYTARIFLHANYTKIGFCPNTWTFFVAILPCSRMNVTFFSHRKKSASLKRNWIWFFDGLEIFVFESHGNMPAKMQYTFWGELILLWWKSLN